ncbi:MAG TPA: hypothetical protein GXX23_09525 [Firmicutes bacterium]|nr:hypothetical protein [Candidatus Fermentithermobacillaceae bacterium]
MSVLKWFGDLDRRWLYLLVLFVVIFPLVNPLGIPIEVTDGTRQFVEAVEKLKPGDRMLLVFDYSIGGGPDVGPQAEIVMAHAFSKGVKVVEVAFLEAGLIHARNAIDKWEKAGKVYGEDIILLGYAAGAETAISAFAQDVAQVFPTDIRGKPLSSYPIMEGIKTAADFDLIAEFATGIPGPPEWVRQVVTRSNVPLACGVVAVMGPQNVPYLQSGQLVGLLGGGLKSAAEYETAIGMPGLATAAMDAQSLGHVVIVLFVLMGNLLFWAERQEQKAKKG